MIPTGNLAAPPCPDWCLDPWRSEEQYGEAHAHILAKHDITPSLGFTVWQAGEHWQVYVADGTYTLDQADQLAKGLRAALELARSVTANAQRDG